MFFEGGREDKTLLTSGIQPIETKKMHDRPGAVQTRPFVLSKEDKDISIFSQIYAGQLSLDNGFIWSKHAARQTL